MVSPKPTAHPTKSEDRFRRLAKLAPVAMFETEENGDCVFVNDRWSALTGISEADALGKGWVRALHPEDRDRVFRAWYDAATAGQEFNLEYRFLSATGRTLWVLGSAVALRDEKGLPTGYLGTVVDMTAQKAASEALARSEANFKLLAERTPTGIVVHRDGAVAFVNPTLLRMLGVENLSDRAGRTLADLVHPDDLPKVAERLHPLPPGTMLPAIPIRCIRPDGREVIVEVTGVEAEFDGKPSRITVMHDVTDRQRATEALHVAHEKLRQVEEELRQLSLQDELTGLYNRRGFFALGEQEFRVSQRTGHRLALLFADLNGMKRVNDELGHDTGDALLRDAANVLKGTVRDSDIVARLGGDEFLVLLVNPDPGSEKIVQSRLEGRIKTFNASAGRNYGLSMSLGFCVFDGNSEGPKSLQDMVADADERMYQAKQRRRTMGSASLPVMMPRIAVTGVPELRGVPFTRS